ncbi:tetratricopeptide repeat protein [Roseivirga misakiensis]|uniref:tetratricopeptide repeat protein n=1 Tax=Roseivirga misakiensis TaxID=1563681 RepID=UPI00114D1E92|nr:tetratricopeptide repeat protein [Roseivirga misakiensis]
MKRLLIYLFVFAQLVIAKSVDGQEVSDSARYLLLNRKLQFQITDAVDSMYNFNFRKAEVDFNWLKYNHPEHPLPYFLFGISTWWQMMPNLNAETPLGDEFIAYMDTAIVKAKAMLKKDENDVEAAFFLAGSYGFQGRYHSEKKNWLKAAGVGKKALKALKKTKGNESFSPEILFGDALFNYYSIWIRENYPSLRPILFFFPKGDKSLGVEQLQEVSQNAFYTRIEAVFFLMRIKAFELKETYDALRLAKQVHTQFPNNPYFHRFYARMLYTVGQYQSAADVSLEILRRLEKGQLGYEEVSGRYASFFLGHISKKQGDWDIARPYFEKVIEYTETISDEKSGYYLFSQMYLAEEEAKSGDYQTALDRIEIIRDNTRRKEDLNKKARALRKVIRKKR